MTTSTFLRYGLLAAAIAVGGAAVAQTPKGLTPADVSAIQALVNGYAKALGSCDAEGFADLFAPGKGSFASGFRGEMVGHQRLIELVQSERQCLAPASGTPTPRPGGSAPLKSDLSVDSAGVHGVVELGRAGEYQDDYVKTPHGWRFASRTVVTPPEKAAGLDAKQMREIRRLSGSGVADYYVPDQNGVKRLRTSGVAINVKDGVVNGRAYSKDGSYDENVYERDGRGRWRIKSSTHVPAKAP